MFCIYPCWYQIIAYFTISGMACFKKKLQTKPNISKIYL